MLMPVVRNLIMALLSTLQQAICALKEPNA